MISEKQEKRAISMYKGLSFDWDAIDETIRTRHKELSDKVIAEMFGATIAQIRKRRYRILHIMYGRGRPIKNKKKEG